MIEHPISLEGAIDEKRLLYLVKDVELLILGACILHDIETPRMYRSDIHVREPELVSELLARELQYSRLQLRGGFFSICKCDYLKVRVRQLIAVF